MTTNPEFSLELHVHIKNTYNMGAAFGKYRKYKISRVGSKQILLGEKVIKHPLKNKKFVFI